MAEYNQRSKESPKADCIITEISYSPDKDFYSYVRSAYTILDFLRDIGGLFGAVHGIFSAFVFLLNFESLYQWLTSQLFRVQLKDDYQIGQSNRSDERRNGPVMLEKVASRIKDSISKDLDKNVSIQRFESMNWSIFGSCCLNIKWMLPSKCKCLCLRESTRDRMFKRGFDKL